MDESQAHTRGWSAAHRIVFRFVFSYLILCVFPFPFSYSPGSIFHTSMYDRMWFAITSWVATHILHITPAPAYFADFLPLLDVTNGYIALLCFLVLAVLATIVWTLLDRNRADYRTLHSWFRIYVRYALAWTMLAYGMDKVLALQFSWSLPGPERLAEPLGNYSPFALLGLKRRVGPSGVVDALEDPCKKWQNSRLKPTFWSGK